MNQCRHPTHFTSDMRWKNWRCYGTSTLPTSEKGQATNLEFLRRPRTPLSTGFLFSLNLLELGNLRQNWASTNWFLMLVEKQMQKNHNDNLCVDPLSRIGHCFLNGVEQDLC